MDPRLTAVHLLLAIVRERIDDACALVRRDGLPGQVFVDACRSADVAPWIHARLTAADAAGLAGRPVLDALAVDRARVRRDNLLLLARAELALDVLGHAGVHPVALKGTDFLHRLYRSFDERTVDDVDLLVRPDEVEAALRALVAVGFRLPVETRALHYVRASHHIPLGAPGPIGVDFELHWNLAQAGRFRIDPLALVERAVPFRVGNLAALRLHGPDVVAHLVLHHFTHYFDRRLKWIVDLQRIAAAGELDWTAALDRLGEWGATQPAAAALVHIRKLVPDLVPRHVIDALPLARWRAALAAPLLAAHPLDLWRGTRRRSVQLYLAAILYERPAGLPAWILSRHRRDGRPSRHPLDAVVRALAGDRADHSAPAGGGR